MLNRTQTTILTAVMSLPMLMGQGCPQAEEQPAGGGVVAGATPVTLLTASLNRINNAAAPVASTVNFNPVAAGKVVTMSIASNATGSRIAVTIIDNLGNVVAQQQFPVTQETTVNFVSTTTGSHQVLLTERGAPGSLYSVRVVQQP